VEVRPLENYVKSADEHQDRLDKHLCFFKMVFIFTINTCTIFRSFIYALLIQTVWVYALPGVMATEAGRANGTTQRLDDEYDGYVECVKTVFMLIQTVWVYDFK
jgi:peptide methionine sulfoxide reductase MsrA